MHNVKMPSPFCNRKKGQTDKLAEFITIFFFFAELSEFLMENIPLLIDPN